MKSSVLKASSLLKGGEYRLVRSLGQGGFGISYLAEQVSLGRNVAIKEFFKKDCCEREEWTMHVTVPTASNRELVNRLREKFVKEAKMIASFDNPHIVKVIDVFEENGTAYYVMEYLPGGSLSDRVRQKGSLPVQEAVIYVRQIADALDYLHSQNTLHLDIKPSNVLLNKKGEAVLIDFGISKHYDEAGHQTSSTPVGISKGYAPLEQYNAGDVKQFTSATDIYSLGATLYNLVTGQMPPEASIVNEDGIPPLPSSVSRAVASAINSAMQPKRKDRPQGVYEFLRLLDGHSAKTDEETTTLKGNQEKIEKKEEVVKKKKTDEGGSGRIARIIASAAAFVILSILCAVFIPKAVHRGGLTYPEVSIDKETEFLEDGRNSNNNTIDVHEYVDLGLSVKWATCNVGATKPEENGRYFAWGDVVGQTWSGSSWSGGGFSDYPAYELDSNNNLKPKYDAAHVKWGGKWRMPTKAEWGELIINCSSTWTDNYKGTGVKGRIFTSKKAGYTDKSIFLPAAGCGGSGSLDDAGFIGHYWSSTFSSGNYAWSLGFTSDGVGKGGSSRGNGQSVRPVSE